MMVCPVTHREAKAFIARNHRHNNPPQGAVFVVGVRDDSGALVGVATAGRPVSRMLDNGTTLEVTRVCTDGARNACSMLYGACRRAALAMGYRRVVTYTLADESGASLRAAGFQRVGDSLGGSWSRETRRRADVDLFGNELKPTGAKVRWEWCGRKEDGDGEA